MIRWLIHRKTLLDHCHTQKVRKRPLLHLCHSGRKGFTHICPQPPWKWGSRTARWTVKVEPEALE